MFLKLIDKHYVSHQPNYSNEKQREVLAIHKTSVESKATTKDLSSTHINNQLIQLLSQRLSTTNQL